MLEIQTTKIYRNIDFYYIVNNLEMLDNPRHRP